MTDRRPTRIVLAGLLALTGACKDEAPAGASLEVDGAKGEGAEAKRADTKRVDPAKAAPAPPAELPPSGHAVAKVGSLLFLSSTGDVGFELPPLGSVAGMTVNVVGEQDGRLVVETLVTEPAEHHCTAALEGLSDFRLRLYLAHEDLLPVLTGELEHAFADGTKVRVARGVPVPAGSSELVVRGTPLRVPVPAERLGRFYSPGSAFSAKGAAGSLAALEGHALTYDGHTLDEAQLYREADEVARFGVTERTSDALVTVRNPCLEVTALVSNERLHSAPPLGGALAGGEEEVMWGGLTGPVGGRLGMPGPSAMAYEVKPGAAITWVDGRPAGQVTADHRFEAAPRNEAGRSCFEAPLVEGQSTTVTLCFTPADVGEVEVALGGLAMGMGGIGLGTLDPGVGIGTGPGIGSTGALGSGSSRGFGSGGKRVPHVRPAKAHVKGSLDKDIIRRIVRAHINEVRYCYNQGLARDPTLAGKVSINFTIGPTGSVPVTMVANSTIKDEAVSNCIAKAVKRWTFPKPIGGGVVVVTYPFVLEPG
jgi:hypothetical protein